MVAPSGPARRSDLHAFSTAGLRLIRLRAHVNPPQDLPKWRDAGAVWAVLELLSPRPGKELTSPDDFVAAFSPTIETFLGFGLCHIEVQSEPNRADRGAGSSWQDGAAFSVWFEEVCHRLRTRFGDDVSIGFPALAASDAPHPDPAARIAASAFLAQCGSAIDVADWVALHIYWRTLEEMRGLQGAMGCLRTYLAAYPEQRFIITAFANVNRMLDSAGRGQQYAEYLTLMAQYDRILGVIGSPLRSSDPGHSALAWIGPGGEDTGVIAVLARRPSLPDPQRLPLAWPTDKHAYLQVFGAHQRAYYDCCQMTGGHNGVDLAVDVERSSPSPIGAALPGTVSQVALDTGGYGYHVRVRSYGPEGEAVTLIYAHLSAIEVGVGSLVDQGDVLGWVASDAQGAAPHLHLGLHVAGIRLPQVHDGLNPRPYLDRALSG